MVFVKLLATSFYISNATWNDMSSLDPCLFVGKNVIALCYVDDILFYAQQDGDIDHIIAFLNQEGILIQKDGSAEGFLGLDVKSIGSSLAPHVLLTQLGLTKQILEALGLCSSFSTVSSPPAEQSPLPKDSSGSPPAGTVNYSAVFGLLMYLCGHLCCIIVLVVHQCTQYTFCPDIMSLWSSRLVGTSKAR
ncbi:hypothetical protein ACHAW6_009856 [Cyclotella cf. meneghiniana]